MYPIPIHNLIRAFATLPGVGQRTAERFVFHLLKSGKKDAAELTVALKNLIETVKSCEICWDFSDRSPCAICLDKKRDPTMLCIVQESQDAATIERTGQYTGRYHILRGLLTPDDEETMHKTKIPELFERIATQTSPIREIILALNPNLAGETTMMFLEKKCKAINPTLTISRLARGLPMGADLQYADDITLGSALKHRQVS